MKLSIAVPARNEADSVGATVEAVTAVLEAAQIDHQVIVVDDASTDATATLVRAVSA